MFCKKCGQKNLDDATFCVKCGARIASAEGKGHARNHKQAEKPPKFASHSSQPTPRMSGVKIGIVVFIAVVAVGAGAFAGARYYKDRADRTEAQETADEDERDDYEEKSESTEILNDEEEVMELEETETTKTEETKIEEETAEISDIGRNEQRYRPALNMYYRFLEIGWGIWDDASDLFCDDYFAASRSNTGYTFRDLDRDGNDELIVSLINKDVSEVGMVWDIFCENSGEITHLVMASERNRYYLRTDGRLKLEASSSALQSETEICHVDSYVGALVTDERLVYNAYEDSTHPWRHITGVNSTETTIVSEDEARAIQAEMESLVSPITLKPFTEYAYQESPVDTETDYILPDSDIYEYAYSELNLLSDEELRIARNEIMARHGRTFNDQTLQDYFNAKSWYTGRYTPDEFDEQMNLILNEIEKANIETIKLLERSRAGDSIF